MEPRAVEFSVRVGSDRCIVILPLLLLRALGNYFHLLGPWADKHPILGAHALHGVCTSASMNDAEGRLYAENGKCCGPKLLGQLREA